MSRSARRPLRYWGISAEGRQRFGVVLTILMTGLGGIGLVAVAGLIVEIARGDTHNADFWSVGVAIIFLTFLLLEAAITRWRGGSTVPSENGRLRASFVQVPLLLTGGVVLWIVAPSELNWLGPVMVGGALLNAWSLRRKRRTVKPDGQSRWPRA